MLANVRFFYFFNILLLSSTTIWANIINSDDQIKINEETGIGKARTTRRIHIPALGLGPYCEGCPKHYCDDDPSIIHGYCCNCATFYDNLPVKCGPSVQCPLNTYDLCEAYEYMMHCCC